MKIFGIFLKSFLKNLLAKKTETCVEASASGSVDFKFIKIIPDGRVGPQKQAVILRHRRIPTGDRVFYLSDAITGGYRRMILHLNK